LFDHVGKNIDEEAAKRSAQSVLMTMVLFGALGAGLFAYTAWRVTEAVIGPILNEVDVDMVELDEPEEEELQAPAPPPPPLAAEPEPEEEEEEEEEEEPDEPEPDEMQDPQELDKEVETEIKETKAPAGSPEGHAQGQEGGTVGGDPESDCLDCTGTGKGIKKIHKTDIRYKRPCVGDFFKYPKAAEDLGLGPVRCIARVYIGADGVPYDVVPDKSKCPIAFHDATRAGIYKCSWYPYKSPGTKEKIPVQTMLGVTFNPPR